MSLYLPAAAGNAVLLERRRKHIAEIHSRLVERDQRAEEYTAKMHHINQRLFVVKAQDNMDPYPGMEPGYYHLLVVPDNAPAHITPYHQDGAYADVGDWIFDALARGDMTQKRVMNQLEQQEKAVEQAAKAEQARQKDDRRTELKERVNAAVRAQVSMDRTIPWTQNSQGRREKKT
jgi:hypothetical protein